MKQCELSSAAPGLHSMVQRLRHWLHHPDGTEPYLAAATDLADLERRMRELELASGGPAFLTFNH